MVWMCRHNNMHYAEHGANTCAAHGVEALSHNFQQMPFNGHKPIAATWPIMNTKCKKDSNDSYIIYIKEILYFYRSLGHHQTTHTPKAQIFVFT